MSEAKSRPKRLKFWIDASLQLRVLLFVLLLLAGSLALAYLTMDRGLASAAEETRRVFIPVTWARETLRTPFYFSSAIILLAGGMLTLLWSHRIIGPILVLTAGLRRVRDGNLKVDIHLRDTDALRETAEDFAAMQASLRKHIGHDRERIASVEERLAALAARPHMDPAAVRELEAVRADVRKLTSFFHL